MVTSKDKKKEEKTLCLLFKDGMCNSDYNKYGKCDGVNAPRECPYKNGGSYAMSVKDVHNRRK